MRARGKGIWYCQVPIYEQSFFFCSNPESAHKLFVKNGLTDHMDVEELKACAGMTHSFVAENGHYVTVIHLVNNDVQTLVHECVHAAWHILDNAGIEVEYTNHEPLAYLVDYLVAQCLSHLVKGEENS